MTLRQLLALVALAILLASCAAPASVDLIIRGGNVYTGVDAEPIRVADVAVNDGLVVRVGDAGDLSAEREIDASGLLVSAGFIDPHTHSLADLTSEERNHNLNYLLQGVTTVFNGNDGGGSPDVATLTATLTDNGVGTNTALLVGHGAVRRAVMDGDFRPPTDAELAAMQQLVAEAMEAGAWGLSSGLFYAPGSFSETAEVIALARTAARYGGIYDTHLRDESSYNIGLLAAVDEALQIGREAGIAVNLAHIKALGVDVWGQAAAVVERVEAARAAGQVVTADQYPWRASGTGLRNTLLPKAMLEGSAEAYRQRVLDPAVVAQHRAGIEDNLRRRGGPESLLMVMSADTSILGKTLDELARERDQDPITTALQIIAAGSTRVASFNMHADDIETFMVQPWVMTSSDGNDGHPRKYASFPKKYQDYVKNRSLLTLEQFLFRSSALTADSFGIRDRGRLATGLAADIIVLDISNFAANADFDRWNALSGGVVHAIVNGQLAIRDGEYTGALAGRVLLKAGD